MNRRIVSRDAARAALENRALLAARSMVDRMRALYRELEQLTEAPISHHRALVCVGNEPQLTASRLAELLGMQRPAVSQLLKSLAARGWIERRRSEEDQRAVHIQLTPAGRQILQATAGRAVFTLQRAVCSLPTAELESLIVGLELLLSQLPDQSVIPASRVRAGRGAGRDAGKPSGRPAAATRNR